MTKAVRHLLGTLLMMLALAACGEDTSKPYFTFAGGGFIFNYRNADAYYGFVLKAGRTPPDGAVLEVDFELPGENRHDLQRVPVKKGQLQYMFRSPDLNTLEQGHDYVAVVRLLHGEEELARYTKSFRANLDLSKLPSEPLVVGPGYQPNPDLPAPE